MAIEEGINIRIGADTASAEKGLNDLQAQLQRLQIALQRASDPKVMDALEEGINKTKLAISQLTPATQNMSEAIAGASSTSVAGSAIRAQYALNGLERGMRSLSTGSMSGAIFGAQQFAREFANLSATAGGTAGAMAKLSSMLFSPIGLIFGIGAIIEIVSSLIKKYGSLNAAIKHITGSWTEADEAHKNFLDVLNAASKTFDKSVENVQELRINLDLASKGFINQKEALKQYNDELGGALGKANSLADAEKKLNANAGAYVQMTMYKALATEYLNKAAKAVSDNLIEQQKTNEDAATFTDRIKSAFSGYLQSVSYFSTGKTVEGLIALWGGYNETLDEAGAATKRLSQLTAQNDWQRFLDQAKNFQKQAAEIAKSAHIDFFEGKETERTKANNAWKKQLEEIKKAAEAIEKVYSKIAGDLMYFYDPLTRIAAGVNQKITKNPSTNPTSGFTIPFLAELQSAADEYQKFFKSSLFESDKFKIAFPKIDLTNLTKAQAEAIGKFVEMREKIVNIFTSIGNLITQTLTQAFSQFFTTLLSGGKNAFQALIKGLEQLIVKLIATAIASAIVAVLLSAIGIGGVNAAGGIAKGISLGASFKNLFGGMMGFANGGIISGPTMAMIGEYPGAASNPEVVAPLDKLQNIMGNGAGNGYIATARISGNDLWIGLQRASQRRDRVS